MRVFAITLAALIAVTATACAKQSPSQEVNMSTNTPKQTETIYFGMGCFWGAEKRMSEIPGVVDVTSGYAGGDAEKAGYYDVLGLEKRIRLGQSDAVNHAEVIKVTFDPTQVDVRTVLIKFWENHNPTQGDRQGNDVGTNYRSAIYYTTEDQKQQAETTLAEYQAALTKAGFPKITTEIAPLKNYNRAEEYHQDYLEKNPNGYCGLGGTGVAFPDSTAQPKDGSLFAQLDGQQLNTNKQLVVYEAEDCAFCKLFKKEIMANWEADVPITNTFNVNAPKGWKLEKTLFATPTIVLFEDGKEVSRYTGYNGEEKEFWKWLGFQLLTPDQKRIAFENGTERAWTGSHLDEKRPGRFVDPISGATLFYTSSKFDSGSGWPSFFQPEEGSITLHEDFSHGMHRVEVRSASSGIHLGHVFDDGPPPTYKRYCINGNVLKFIPDEKVASK